MAERRGLDAWVPEQEAEPCFGIDRTKAPGGIWDRKDTRPWWRRKLSMIRLRVMGALWALRYGG